jgi:hypothetical protein
MPVRPAMWEAEVEEITLAKVGKSLLKITKTKKGWEYSSSGSTLA